MNNSIALSIGIDRCDRHVDFTVLDANGVVLDHGRVGSDPAALHPWFKALRGKCPEGCSIAVAFEQPAPNLIVFFSQFDCVVLYALNPAALRSYCRSFSSCGAHTDRSDAAMITRYLLTIMGVALLESGGRAHAPPAKPRRASPHSG